VRRKNHYTILGITRGASPEGVRAAFLRLAKERHPDRAGEASTPAFREIQQAYDVLSDPDRRRLYDREFDQKTPTRRRYADHLTQQQDVEPLIPDPWSAVPRRPNRGPLFDRFPETLGQAVFPMTGHGPGSKGVIDAAVLIGAAFAERGGLRTISIPVREICCHCSGTGILWPSPCPTCSRTGWIVREREFYLRLPPGIRHGTVIHLRSEEAGGVEIRLRLLIGKERRAPPGW
jgi:molecular chaperone DnaJ